MSCPNKSSQEYKQLVLEFGEEAAMAAFIANTNQVPTANVVAKLVDKKKKVTLNSHFNHSPNKLYTATQQANLAIKVKKYNKLHDTKVGFDVADKNAYSSKLTMRGELASETINPIKTDFKPTAETLSTVEENPITYKEGNEYVYNGEVYPSYYDAEKAYLSEAIETSSVGIGVNLPSELQIGDLTNDEVNHIVNIANYATLAAVHSLEAMGEPLTIKNIKKAVRTHILNTRFKSVSKELDKTNFHNKAELHLLDNSKLWDKIFDNFANTYYYDIEFADTEAFEEDDLTKSYDDNDVVKQDFNKQVAREIVNFISSIQYNSTNTPSGVPNFVSFKEISPKLLEICKGCVTYDDMINQLRIYASTAQLDQFTVFKQIADKLETTSLGFKNLFFSRVVLDTAIASYDLYKSTELIDEEGDYYTVNTFKTNVSNRNANTTYKSYDKIIDNIQRNFDSGTYTKEGFNDTWNNTWKQVLSDVSVNPDSLYTGVSKLWNLLAIDINPDIIRGYVESSRNKTVLDKRRKEIETELLTNVKYLKDWIDKKKADVNTKSVRATNSGYIFRVAEILGKYTESPVYAYTNVTGNLVYTTQKPSALSKFFAKIKGTNRDIAELTVKEYCNCPQNQFLSLLWGSEVNPTTGKVDVKKPGLVNYIKSGDTKIYHSLNEDFINEFEYYLVDGVKSVDSDSSKQYDKYSDSDYILNSVLSYFTDSGKLAASSEYGTIPMFVMSDRKLNYKVRIPKLNILNENTTSYFTDLINGVEVGEIPKEVRQYFLDLVLADVNKIRNAKSVLFTSGEYDNNSYPVLKPEVLNGSIKPQLYHHVHSYNDSGRVTIDNVFGKKELPSGLRFTTLLRKDGTSLNDIKELFDDNGLLKDSVSIEFNEDVIKHVDLFIKDLIVDTVTDLNKYKQDITKYRDNKGKLIISNYNAQLAEFSIADYIYRYNLYSLLIGTSDNFKSTIEMNKRAGMVLSSGLQNANYTYSRNGSDLFYNGTFKGVTIKDNKVVSNSTKLMAIYYSDVYSKNDPYKKLSFNYDNLIAKRSDDSIKLNELEQLIYYKLLPYFDINTADAASFITIDEFEKRILGFGLDKKYKQAIESYKSGNITPLQLDTFIELQKNIYFGVEYDSVLNKMIPKSIKNAEFVLSPKVSYSNELDTIYNVMKSTGISQLNFESATKTGVTSTIDIFDEYGNLLDISTLTERFNTANVEYRYDNLLMQQEFVTHQLDGGVKLSIPVQKKILTDLSKDSIYTISGFNNKLNGGQIKDHWFNLLSTDAKNNSRIIEDILAVKGTDEEKYRKIVNLIEQAAEKDPAMSELASYAKSVYGQNPNGIKPLINFVTSSLKIENLITSVYNNRISNRKINGFHSPVISNILGKPRAESSVSRSNVVMLYSKYRTKYSNPKPDGRLNYIENSDGIIQSAECYVSELFFSKYVKSDTGRVDINKIAEEAPELLNIVGLRVPTEDKHSMFVLKIVGILPNDVASGIVLPDEYVAQLGQDFDFDSVYCYIRDFNLVKGKYKVSRYTDIPTDKETKSRYRNYVLSESSKEGRKEYNEIKDDYFHLLELYNEGTTELYTESKAKLDAAYNVSLSIFKELDKSIKQQMRDMEKQFNIDGKTAIEKTIGYYMFAQTLTDVVDSELLTTLLASYEDILSQYKLSLNIKPYVADIIASENAAIMDILNHGINALLDANLNQLADDNNIMSYDKFKELPVYEQLSRKELNNSIVDVLEGVLSNSHHYESIITASGFPHTAAIANTIRDIKFPGSYVDPYSFLGNNTFRKINIQGRDLKGKSVSFDNFIAVGQIANITTGYNFKYKLLYKDSKLTREELERNYPDSEFTDDYAIITEYKIGSNPSGGYVNAKGELITNYSAETTAHILDIVKNPFVPNVNDYTFGIWKFMTQYNIEYASLFINQPIIDKILEIKEKYSRVSDTKYATDEIIVNEALKSFSEIINIQDYNKDTTFSENDLLSMIVDFKNGNVSETLLKNQRIIASQFLQFMELSNAISAVNSKLRLDKSGIGVDITKGLELNNAIESDSSNLLNIDGQGVLESIYKSNSYSYFKSLKTLGVDNAISYISPLFIRYSSDTSFFINNVLTRYSASNQSSMIKRLNAFTNSYLIRGSSFLNITKQEQKRLLGTKHDVPNFKISLESTISNDYANLSVANKLELVKDAILEYNKTSDSKLNIQLLDYLKGQVSEDDHARNGYHKIILYNADLVTTFKDNFNFLYYSNNEILKDLAKDLIRYEYFTNGFTFGFNSISKLIPLNIFALSSEEGYDRGIGILDYYDSVIKQDNFINSDELNTRYIQNNISDSRLVRNVTGRLVKLRKSKSVKDLTLDGIPAGYILSNTDKIDNSDLLANRYVKLSSSTKRTVDKDAKYKLYKVIATDKNVVLLEIPSLIGNELDWKSIDDSRNPKWTEKYNSIDDAITKIESSNAINIEFSKQGDVKFEVLTDNSYSARRELVERKSDITINITDAIKDFAGVIPDNKVVIQWSDIISPDFQHGGLTPENKINVTGEFESSLSALSKEEYNNVINNLTKIITSLSNDKTVMISDGQSGISELAVKLFKKINPSGNVFIFATPDYAIDKVTGKIRNEKEFKDRYDNVEYSTVGIDEDIPVQTPVERIIEKAHIYLVNKLNDLHITNIKYGDPEASKLLSDLRRIGGLKEIITSGAKLELLNALDKNLIYLKSLVTPTDEFNVITQLETYIDADLVAMIPDSYNQLVRFSNKVQNIIDQGEALYNLEFITGDNLSTEDNVINEKIKETKELMSSISNIKTKFNVYNKKFFEAITQRTNTNPNMAFRELWDAELDESQKQFYLDAMADTNNTFIANIVQWYKVKRNEYHEDGKVIKKEFEKLAVKHFGLKNAAELDSLTADDWAPFLDVVDGQSVARFLPKYDYQRYYNDKLEYETALLKQELKHDSFQFMAKMKAWDEANSNVVYNKTKVISIIKEAVEQYGKESAEYAAWYNTHIKTSKYGNKYYVAGLKKEPGDKYIKPEFIKLNPRYKEGIHNELYDWFYEKLPDLVRDSVDKGNPLLQHLIPVVKNIEKGFTYNVLHPKEYYDSLSAKTDSVFERNGRLIHEIKLDGTGFLSDIKPIRISKIEGETVNKYRQRLVEAANDAGHLFKTYEEVVKYNDNAKKLGITEHSSKVNTNLGIVIPTFIDKLMTFKLKRDFRYYAESARETFKEMDIIQQRSVNEVISKFVKYDHPKINKLSTKKGIESLTYKHFNEWLDAVVYGNFDIDEGQWTNISKILQRYTSAKFMWLNLTGGINNVAIGKIQMALESASGYHVTRSDLLGADKLYFSSIADVIANSGKRSNSTLIGALIKDYDIIENQDEKDYEVRKLHKKLFSTNSLFLIQHMGEHYMQNTMLLAMMNSHRIVDGRIVSFTDYKRNYNLDEKVLLDILTEDKLKDYTAVKDKAVARIKKYNTKENYVTNYLKTADISVSKEYVKKRAEVEETLRKEFESGVKVIDAYELKDGDVIIKESINVDQAEIAIFKEKVIKVNQKAHGIYNRSDASIIQRRGIGKLAMQFRKHLVPGWNKRFGSRFMSSYWNLPRADWDKGMYKSFVDFVIVDPIRAGIDQSRIDESNALKSILKSYFSFLKNLKLYYKTLDDFERGNVKRTLQELTFFAGAILIGFILRNLGGDDDKEESGIFNAILYQQDRLMQELMMYHIGSISEGKQVLKSPVAGFKAATQLGKAFYNLAYYPFMDEDERTIEGGMYDGYDKLLGNTVSGIPVGAQIIKLSNMDRTNKYYALFRPIKLEDKEED